MNRPNDMAQLDTWLALLLQGKISSEQRNELQAEIADDIETLDYCLDYLVVCAGLKWICRKHEQKTTHHLEKSLHKHIRGIRTWKIPSQTVLSITRIAAVVLFGIGVALTSFWMIQRSRSGVARLTYGPAVVWADDGLAADQGTRLPQGPRHLLQGLAEIQMTSGTQLLLQGPCRFSLEGDNQIYLTSGMLTARVPKKAKGFTVRTKYVSVVDYGTEFGVIAEPDGSIEAHVFSGSVALYVDPNIPEAPAPMPLRAGTAGIFDATGTIKRIPSAPERFMRNIPDKPTKACPGKRLDLADIVGGGNGYGTGVLDRGIDPANGQTLISPSSKRSWDQQGGYIILMNWRYVDGVFVPNSESGQCGISSTGLVFPDCPRTDGSYYDGIFNGAKIASLNTKNRFHQGRLHGEEYGTVEHPALNLHPNAGITFDLDRLRRDNPGVSIQSLRALCGISETAAKNRKSQTDFWVIIDGVVRFHHTCAADAFSIGYIDIELDNETRFVSLATTCRGNTDYCWGIFGEPFLVLVPQR